MGNRTAAPLLASFAASTLLCWQGVAFNPWIWLPIDAATVAAIVWLFKRYRQRSDLAVLAMFIPALVAYAVPEPWRFTGTFTAVVSQFLITVPWVALWHRIRAVNARFDVWRHFDWKVAV
jgi:hypothetical protein